MHSLSVSLLLPGPAEWERAPAARGILCHQPPWLLRPVFQGKRLRLPSFPPPADSSHRSVCRQLRWENHLCGRQRAEREAVPPRAGKRSACLAPSLAPRPAGGPVPARTSCVCWVTAPLGLGQRRVSWGQRPPWGSQVPETRLSSGISFAQLLSSWRLRQGLSRGTVVTECQGQWEWWGVTLLERQPSCLPTFGLGCSHARLRSPPPRRSGRAAP